MEESVLRERFGTAILPNLSGIGYRRQSYSPPKFGRTAPRFIGNMRVQEIKRKSISPKREGGFDRVGMTTKGAVTTKIKPLSAHFVPEHKGKIVLNTNTLSNKSSVNTANSSNQVTTVNSGKFVGVQNCTNKVNTGHSSNQVTTASRINHVNTVSSTTHGSNVKGKNKVNTDCHINYVNTGSSTNYVSTVKGKNLVNTGCNINYVNASSSSESLSTVKGKNIVSTGSSSKQVYVVKGTNSITTADSTNITDDAQIISKTKQTNSQVWKVKTVSSNLKCENSMAKKEVKQEENLKAKQEEKPLTKSMWISKYSSHDVIDMKKFYQTHEQKQFNYFNDKGEPKTTLAWVPKRN